MCALDTIKYLIKENKRLEDQLQQEKNSKDKVLSNFEKVSLEFEEAINQVVNLKSQVDKSEKFIISLKSNLLVKANECLRLELDIVSLKKELENVSIELHKSLQFEKSTEFLNDVLSKQKHYKDITGLGYEEGKCSKVRNSPRKKIDLGHHVVAPTNKTEDKYVGEGRRKNKPLRPPFLRYNYSQFHGY